MKDRHIVVALVVLIGVLVVGWNCGRMEQKNTIALHDKTPTIGSYCRTDWDKYQKFGLPQKWTTPRTGAVCATLEDFGDRENITLSEMHFRVILPNGTAAEFSRWYDAVEWLDEQPAP